MSMRIIQYIHKRTLYSAFTQQRKLSIYVGIGFVFLSFLFLCNSNDTLQLRMYT